MKYPLWQRYAIAAVCAYEAVAIVSDDNSRIPTITYVQTRTPRKSLGAVIVTALAVHFIRATR